MANSRHTAGAVMMFVAAALAGSCGRGEPGGGGAEKAAAGALPAGLFLSAAPEGARPLEAAREGLKAGSAIVFSGRVGGSMEPFGEGTAVMLVMGDGLFACSDVEGVKCATPWDYCCDNEEVRAGHSAVVRVMGSGGEPVGRGLKGERGLKELSRVVVKGKVAKVEETGRVWVDAEGIWVTP